METRTHLLLARGRGSIGDDELTGLSERYREIERMLTGLIKHLRRENRRSRG